MFVTTDNNNEMVNNFQAVNSTDSSNHLVSGNLYFSQLQRLYKTFTLFMGSFSLLLEHLNNDMIAFKQKLFEFFTWVSKLFPLKI